tara:strand:+ start:39 stop:737 length:699 start_codon:yes stop_codon:yes gene_type:complete
MKVEVLSEKITPKEIQWRIQSSKNGKTSVVPYLTNRCVMERFDKACGVTGWKNTFEEWRVKGVKCGISVWAEDMQEWITKYDGADETNIEPTKGGFSDSMKRSAVQWGLGRDLYDYPMIQLEGETKFISRQQEKQLSQLSKNISEGNETREYVLIAANQPARQQAPTPLAKPIAAKPKEKEVIVFGENTKFKTLIKWISEGEGTIEKAKAAYSISEEVEEKIKTTLMLKEIG